MVRNQDLVYLNNIYKRDSNDIIVLYGDKKSCLTDLIKVFIKDKKSFYYKASEIEFSSQIALFSSALHNQNIVPQYVTNDYDKYLLSFLEKITDYKKVFIIDDFLYLLLINPTFINYILSFVSENCKKGSVLFVLCTTNNNWVENDMIKFLGNTAYELSAIYKIKPLSFFECMEYANLVSISDCFFTYNALGGNQIFWTTLKENKSYRDILISILEDKHGSFVYEGFNILPKDLRNPSVYNTILYGLSGGANKLNDLHNFTGIDRAKLVVYLKKLMAYGLVLKNDGIEIGNENNIQKGSYMIADPFVRFWYYYIFPNYSSFNILSGEKFYKNYIEPDYLVFCEKYYPCYCIEKFKQMNINGELPFSYMEVDFYYDKTNTINFIAKAVDNSYILCACSSLKTHMFARCLDEVIEVANKNNIPYNKIMLFSSNGFDQKLNMTSAVDDNIILIDEKHHWNNTNPKNGVK